METLTLIGTIALGIVAGVIALALLALVLLFAFAGIASLIHRATRRNLPRKGSRT